MAQYTISYDVINKRKKLPNLTLLQTGQPSHNLNKTMMGPKPLGYILCLMEVCPLVREIFEGFLLHLDVMAIWFM